MAAARGQALIRGVSESAPHCRRTRRRPIIATRTHIGTCCGAQASDRLSGAASGAFGKKQCGAFLSVL